jgi:predicted dienelactone hydrolase
MRSRRRRFAIVVILAAVLLMLIAGRHHAKGAPSRIDSRINVGALQVEVWLPAASVPGPWPAILFSHGFHGCNTQSVFLMNALAQAGYAVFAPNHHDATCNDGESRWLDRSEVGFRDVEDWTAATYTDRRDDIETLLNLLPRDPRFSRSVDWSRVGLAGHSLGGYTVLALAGAWPSWKDNRVKAVLALSPFSAPFAKQRTLANIRMPVMYQGGTRDFGITPGLKKQDGVYDQTSAPKFFVEISGAGHLAFTDLRDVHHGLMSAYAVAFFDSYLKGEPFPSALRQQGDGIAELRIDANTN